MTAFLKEISLDEVVGLNRAAIERHNLLNPSDNQNHQLVRPNDLASCIGGIFYQSQNGYSHLPLEKMAGLLLYRIAEGQFFEDGNKRTALLSCITFLGNNGYRLRTERKEVRELLLGFAKPNADIDPRYDENDSIQFIFDNILPPNIP